MTPTNDAKNRFPLPVRALLVLLLTLLLLEVTTRLVWWNRPAASLFGRQVTLLPRPLVTAEQVGILEEWSASPVHYVRFDPVLGWSITPATTAEWEGTVYTSNSIGIRSQREYSLEKPAGVTRIAAFGPSFTHADEVQGHETWAAQMEQARPDLEVMNWGVGGYGTDQAFLRYQTQGAAYRPDIVIIGFEEDNFNRNANRFRPFFRPETGLPLPKPVFIAGENGLELVANPFPDLDTFKTTLLDRPERFLALLCPHDFFCDPEQYRPAPLDVFTSYRFFRTLAYRVSRPAPAGPPPFQNPALQRVNYLLLQAFVAEVARNGAIPIVLIFPELKSIRQHEAGQPTDYQGAVDLLHQQGLPVIDLAAAFVAAKKNEGLDYPAYYASEGGHFNGRGNGVVAQAVLWHLCSQGLLQNCR